MYLGRGVTTINIERHRRRCKVQMKQRLFTIDLDLEDTVGGLFSSPKVKAILLRYKR